MSVRDLKSTRSPDASSRWLRLRVTGLGFAFLFLLCGVLARAVYLQVVERDRLREMAQEQYVRQVEVPARRGDIFDRRGVPLAQSVEVDSIWVDPSLLPDLGAATRQLALALHLDADELGARLVRAKRFAWVKRQARPDEVLAAQALALPGMGVAKEPHRFYPQRELAGHVIGLVGSDGRGLEGLELAFDDELSAQSSQRMDLRDAKGRKLTEEPSALEHQGAAVTLTLDRHAQYLAERALARAVEESKAVAGMAIILDPRTGELLALANYPRFNPNTPQDSDARHPRDRAALDAFEPGSTFKSFVVAAALEEGAIKPDDIFYCENGAWDVGHGAE